MSLEGLGAHVPRPSVRAARGRLLAVHFPAPGRDQVCAAGAPPELRRDPCPAPASRPRLCRPPASLLRASSSGPPPQTVGTKSAAHALHLGTSTPVTRVSGTPGEDEVGVTPGRPQLRWAPSHESGRSRSLGSPGGGGLVP